MSEVEIGRAKRARRVYAFDDIAIVPSRRTRDPQDVSVSWTIDAYQFDIPFLAAPMDSVVSPGHRHRDGPARRPRRARPRGPLDPLRRPGAAARRDPRASRRRRPPRACRQIYAEPIKPELDQRAPRRDPRRRRHRRRGALARSAPRSSTRPSSHAGVDLFVIRGTTVSAEHVSKNQEPLNLKKFIYELDVPVIVGGAATYTAGAAPHAHRRGRACSSASAAARRRPRAPASASTPRWRRRWRMSPALAATTWTSPAAATCTSSPTAASAPAATSSRRSRSARTPSCSARTLARATEAPGGGWHWGAEAHHSELPRGNRVEVGSVAPLEQILFGPSTVADGTVEPRRRAAPVDGDDRLLRPQGIPARRGRRRAVSPASTAGARLED